MSRQPCSWYLYIMCWFWFHGKLALQAQLLNPNYKTTNCNFDVTQIFKQTELKVGYLKDRLEPGRTPHIPSLSIKYTFQYLDIAGMRRQDSMNFILSTCILWPVLLPNHQVKHKRKFHWSTEALVSIWRAATFLALLVDASVFTNAYRSRHTFLRTLRIHSLRYEALDDKFWAGTQCEVIGTANRKRRTYRESESAPRAALISRLSAPPGCSAKRF